MKYKSDPQLIAVRALLSHNHSPAEILEIQTFIDGRVFMLDQANKMTESTDENGTDLARLCVLMHTKNEYQAQRHHARRQEMSFAHALSWKKVSKKRAQLEKLANQEKNPVLKKLVEIQNIRQTLPVEIKAHLAVGPAIDEVMSGIGKAKQELHYLPLLRSCDVSGKNKRLSNSDLIILKREAHIANEMAKLNIAKFTKAHRKEMKDITVRNSWRIETDKYNGFYTGVRKGLVDEPGSGYNDSFIVRSREQIAHNAATQALEDAMVAT